MPKDTNAFGLAAQGTGSAVVLNIIFWIALVISIPLRGFNPALRLRRARRGLPARRPSSARSSSITRGQRHADTWLRALARRVPALNPDKISALLVEGRRPHHPADQQPTHPVVRRSRGRRSTGCSTPRACGSSSGPSATSISPIDLLVAYGLANILAAIPITPAGLGRHRGCPDPDAGRLRRAPQPGDPRRAGLSPRQLLDPDPHRRRRLRQPAVATRRARARSESERDRCQRQPLELRLRREVVDRLQSAPAPIGAEHPGEAGRRAR